MDYEISDTIYCYPGSNVLKNKLNIRDADTLENAERELTAIRISELKINPIYGHFDLEHLKNIHRYIFQDVYDWAGELRRVRITKGFMFAYPENIENQSNLLFKRLNEDKYLKGMEIEEFCNKLAYYKTELNVLHPFREGNGRAIREFIQCLARYNRYELEFNILDRDEYLVAMIKSPYDTTLLENLLKRITTKS